MNALMPAETPFYNDLTASLAEARAILENGACNRKAAAHSPVVATINRNGAPSQRVMILRSVDWASRRLRFHSDWRTEKIAELSANAATSVLLYEPGPKIQLRLSGAAQIMRDGQEADAAWEQATLFARRCYLADAAPGTPSAGPTSGLSAAVEGRMPSEAEIRQGRVNFAILLFEFTQIEWLYLANSGHRRARWTWNSAARDWSGGWLVP